MGNVLTKEQYYLMRSERIGASAIERTGLYEANILQVPPVPGTFAVKDTVQITDIKHDGQDFRFSMRSHTSGAITCGRVTLNGIMYQDDSPEKGYLVAPPMDDLDHELDELCGELLDYIPLYSPTPNQDENTRHLEAPLQ